MPRSRQPELAFDGATARDLVKSFNGFNPQQRSALFFVGNFNDVSLTDDSGTELLDDEDYPELPDWEQDLQRAVADMDLDDMFAEPSDYRVEAKCPACGWSDSMLTIDNNVGEDLLSYRHHRDKPACAGKLAFFYGPFGDAFE